MADNSLALQDINNFSAVSLLIQSLVRQLCKLLASSPRQQKVLYKGNSDGFLKDEASVLNNFLVLLQLVYTFMTIFMFKQITVNNNICYTMWFRTVVMYISCYTLYLFHIQIWNLASWLRLFIVFLSLSRQMVGHNCFLSVLYNYNCMSFYLM